MAYFIIFRNTFNKILQNFVNSHEENQKLIQHRETFLIRLCFQKWYVAIPELQDENIKAENEYDEIVQKFRFVIIVILIKYHCN